MGGAPKPARTVGGVPLLTRVLTAVTAADPRIVVGPAPPHPPAGVLFTREEPPGGGPVAAVAAGLALVPATIQLTAILGADLPFLTADAVDRLSRALSRDIAQDDDGCVYIDSDGRHQWLCGVWRTAALRERLRRLGDPSGRGMRHLTEGLRLATLTTVADPPPWFDCDTEDDLRRAEEWAHDR
jgi:molybdopterin-guanine dinucleotide biosynthesis protein A